MTFDTAGLHPALLRAVAHLGYVEMTAIQARALPPMLSGRDVAGQAKTGSGKTAAFGLALLQRVDPAVRAVQGLVICPTRELAVQVTDALRQLASRLPNVQVLTVSGGRPYHREKIALRHGCQIVVGTPGRLCKHLRSENLDLSALRVLALDEADRMLDMGFTDEVMDIVGQCPAERQTLLFSATFPDAIHQLRDTVQRDAVFVEVAPQAAPAALRQAVSRCAPEARGQRVAELLAHHRPERALVFCETRDDTEHLAAHLRELGAWVRPMHGLLDQRTRDGVLMQLSQHSIGVVVATDVAARGLDVPDLPLVIVAELSPDPEVHLHRIGRTGRAGAEGLALSIVTPREEERLARVEAFLGRALPEEPPPPPLPEGLALPAPPNRTLLLLAGRRDKLRKGDVLGALVKAGGVPPEAIGDIDLRPQVCAVAVARAYARQALRAVRSGRIKKKRVRAELL